MCARAFELSFFPALVGSSLCQHRHFEMTDKNMQKFEGESGNKITAKKKKKEKKKCNQPEACKNASFWKHRGIGSVWIMSTIRRLLWEGLIELICCWNRYKSVRQQLQRGVRKEKGNGDWSLAHRWREREAGSPPGFLWMGGCVVSISSEFQGGKNNKRVGKCFEWYVIWSCFKNVQLLSHNLIFS